MKTKYPFILLLILIIQIKLCFSQTELAIAFTGFNSDNPDRFTFIAIESIPSGTVIYFTDRGWKQDGSFRSGEGTITWNAPSETVDAGTLIEINADVPSASTGTVSGSITLASGSDQILAYTGSEMAPEFLSAINFSSTNGWDDDATSTNESALPAGLKNDSTAMALPNLDNSIYTGNFSGKTTELLQKINNPENWYGSESYYFNLEPVSFPYNVFISSGEWNSNTNWKTGIAADTDESVIIAENIDAEITTSDGECNNLFIEPRGTVIIHEDRLLEIKGNLVLHSRSPSYASAIISEGTLTIDGLTSYERWVHSDDWHIIASPVSGQKIDNFIATNKIQYFSEDENYDLAPYNENNDAWGPYADGSDEASLAVGRGYATRRSIDEPTEGIIKFSGELNQSSIQLNITRNNNGWNCIGNPFASPISGTGIESFIGENSSQIDPGYAGIYLWDYEIDDYVVYGNSDNAKIAPCQGFIIKSKLNGGSINFNTDMQVFASPSFKSEVIPWPEIILSVSSKNYRNITRVVFNDEMTTAFDATYDLGKLKGNPDFSVYTRQMNNNEIDLALQALPLNNHESLRIPLGFDCKKSQLVTFTAEALELPPGMRVILEDSKEKTYTYLDEPNASYSTMISENTNGTGRFYLLTVERETTHSLFVLKNEIDFTIERKKITIHQQLNPGTSVTLYNSAGKKCLLKTVDSELTCIDASTLPDGIYVLHITGKKFFCSDKLLLTN